jgi:8-oxo-dGTP pyrophosphatase MutT (NUDIX family)
MSTQMDRSYGIIPVRKGGMGWEVLLIHQISNARGDSYWIVPKGHPESGESPVETATRELYEETGLRPDSVNDAHPITLSYRFKHAGAIVQKTAVFFVGYIARSAELTLQVAEVKEAVWLPLHAAQTRITHANARRMLQKVEDYLAKT